MRKFNIFLLFFCLFPVFTRGYYRIGHINGNSGDPAGRFKSMGPIFPIKKIPYFITLRGPKNPWKKLPKISLRKKIIRQKAGIISHISGLPFIYALLFSSSTQRFNDNIMRSFTNLDKNPGYAFFACSLLCNGVRF
ncbi:hypothetical protein ACFL35_09450 [Candidatus Riflebacteria bacterium]